MTDCLHPAGFSFARLARLREVLELAAALRDIREPLTSETGLRKSLDLLARFAELAGVDLRWVERVRQVLADPGVFRIVLAIVQYVMGSPAQETRTGALRLSAARDEMEDEVLLDAQSFLDWLPLVVQVVSLLRQARETGCP